MYSELASSRLQFWGGQLWRLLHWPVTTRRLLLYQLQGHHQVEKVAEEQLVSGHLDPCSDQSSVNLLFVGHLELVVLLLWRYSRWGNQLWFESPRPEHDACLCQEARKRGVAVRKKESGSLMPRASRGTSESWRRGGSLQRWTGLACWAWSQAPHPHCWSGSTGTRSKTKSVQQNHIKGEVRRFLFIGSKFLLAPN